MNKNMKLIICMVIIILLTTCISVYATYKYFAKDVSYTKLDGTEISVQDALNELYGKKPNIECIWASTDNLVTPHSIINNTTTIKHDGILIIDMAGVEGNGTLNNKWTHNVKVNNNFINSTGGQCNGWNGHYYYMIQVKTGDTVSVYSNINYTANYNAVSVGGYLVY